MRKILALCLSAIMVMAAFAGALTVSAEDGAVAPLYLVDGTSLNPLGGNGCQGEYDFDKGCITLKTTNDDPYYTILSTGEPSEAAPEEVRQQVGDYIVIKYRTSQEGVKGAFFMCYNSDIVTLSNAGIDVVAEFEYEVSEGDEWNTAVICLPDEVAVEAYNPADKLLKYVRFDVINEGAAADMTVDVEYIAFFDSESDAEAFEHVLPVMEGDGSYKTLDFSTVTEDNFAATESALFGAVGTVNRHGVAITAGLGYVTFTATPTTWDGGAFGTDGQDPYVRFNDTDNVDGDAQPDFGIYGYQAAYIVVKYRTEADSQAKTNIQFFTNHGGTGWGADGSYIVSELDNCGEWRYAVVDTTTSFGTSTNSLYAFRLDPLESAVAGESIDIAEMKFFGQLSFVYRYIETLAAEEDEAAMDYVENKMPCQHKETEEIPAVPATCTSFGKTAGEKCTKCGDVLVRQKTVAKLDHTVVTVEEKAPTATEPGNTSGTKCDVCGTILSGVETIPATGTPGTPGTEESTPVTEESTPATEESTPAVEDETAPATEEDTTVADEETTAEVEETTAPADKAPAGDESTEAPAAAGCKGVIASASILAVVAMAGVVVCKKKD